MEPYLVTPTGFEPAYIAVKGLCLQPLDDGAMHATYFWLGSCQTYTLKQWRLERSKRLCLSPSMTLWKSYCRTFTSLFLLTPRTVCSAESRISRCFKYSFYLPCPGLSGNRTPQRNKWLSSRSPHLPSLTRLWAAAAFLSYLRGLATLNCSE